MRLRRSAAILLVAALFTGGVTIGLGLAGRTETTTGVAFALQPVAGRAGTSESATRREPVKLAPKAAALAVVPVAAPAKLTGDEAAAVAEMAELQLLAQGTGLVLDSVQWAKLAAVTLDVQTIRQNYEAEIAQTTALAPGRYRVEIPGYVSAGATLRAKFYAALGRELGDAVAADVIEKMGARLEGHFGGFGVSLQTLEVATTSAGGDVEITRTVNYWNRAEEGERLVTRRETHLPAWEDPSGERWGAMLAVITRSGTAG
jgi:hypothetical protein